MFTNLKNSCRFHFIFNKQDYLKVYAISCLYIRYLEHMPTFPSISLKTVTIYTRVRRGHYQMANI